MVNGPAVSKPPSQVVDMETCISCSGRVSIRFELCFLNNANSRARDLVTMVEVGSTRLTSLERVTTGAGSVSRGARAKPNSALARQIAATFLICRCGFHDFLYEMYDLQ